MILKIGTFPHPARKAWIATSKYERLSGIGRRIGYDTTIDCGGDLVQKDGDVDALTTQMQALDAACSGNKDIVLYKEDGITPTLHRYINADTLDGIRLVRPGFQWLKGGPNARNAYGSGTQYLNRRTWQARFHGCFLSVEHNIAEWYEWIEVVGDGGPIFCSKGAIYGPVQFQQLQAFSPIIIIQSGHAVGVTATPSPAGPVFPAAVHRERTRIRRFTPKYGPYRNTGFGIKWTYVMEAASFGSVSPTGIP